MRRCLVLLLFVWCAIASAADAPRKVLVLGDSLSAAHNIPVEAGWVRLLDARTSKMATPWTMVNASISGETSLSGRNRLPALLAKQRPGVVVLELGANDGLQGLPLSQLAANLDAMIEAAKAGYFSPHKSFDVSLLPNKTMQGIASDVLYKDYTVPQIIGALNGSQTQFTWVVTATLLTATATTPVCA